MSMTIRVGSQNVSIIEGTFKLSDRLDDKLKCSFTVLDNTGALIFQHGQTVLVTDSTRGTLFAGFVDKPTATNLWPSAAQEWSIDCVNKFYVPAKKTSKRKHKKQPAGAIAALQIQQYTEPSGVSGNFGLDFLELQSDWQTGTHSNTTAATNYTTGNEGAGDLELVTAGNQVLFQQSSQVDFNAGTTGGGLSWNTALNGVTFTSTPAIKFVAVESLSGNSSAYTYVKIWDHVLGSYAIAASDTLYFDVWIADSCPQQKSSLEIVFTDGTSMQASQSVIGVDVQGVGPAISNDLSGLATNTWYNRRFFLDGGGVWVGKSISYVAVATAGSAQGTYTSYFRNIYIANGATTKLTILSTTATVIPIVPQQLQNSGYATSGMSCTLVTSYERHGYMYSPYFSISGAILAQSSYLHWVATLPNSNFTLTITASLATTVDSVIIASTFLPCTNNAAIPGILPGMNLSGQFLLFAYVMNNAGNDPTLTPVFSSIAGNVSPAYPCIKTDVVNTTNITTGWSGGVLTDLINGSGNILQMNGYARNYDDAVYSNQTSYGAGFSAQGVSSKQFYLTCTASSECRSRLDFAGQWADFTAEVDLVLTTGVAVGFVYRTTNWVTADSTWAYAIELQPTTLKLQRGPNAGSTAGTVTTIGSATVSYTSGTTHHLKLVTSGSSHTIYVDDVQVLHVTDSTYTAVGYLALRNRNTIASTQTATFDNFGIMQALSGTWVSPAIDIHTVGTAGNSQIILQTDPNINYSLVSFLVEISLNNGSTWTTCPNNVATSTGYYQVLPVPGLSAGTNVSSMTQVLLRLTISATTASVGNLANYTSPLADLTAVTLWAIGAYNSSGSRTNAPIASDTMIRPDVSGGFGTNTRGETYTQSGTGTVALTSNEATITNTTGNVFMQSGTLTGGDMDGSVRFALSASGISGGLALRYTDSGDCYLFEASTTTLTFVKISGNLSITLATVAMALMTGSYYWLHFRVTGDGSSAPVNLYGTVYADGTTEPSTWGITATD